MPNPNPEKINVSGPDVPADLENIDFSYARNKIKEGQAIAPQLATSVVEYVRHSARLKQNFSPSLAAYALNLLTGKYDGNSGRIKQETKGEYDESLLSNKKLIRMLAGSASITEKAESLLTGAAVNPEKLRAEKERRIIESLFERRQKVSLPAPEHIKAIMLSVKTAEFDRAILMSRNALAEHTEDFQVRLVAANAFYYGAEFLKKKLNSGNKDAEADMLSEYTDYLKASEVLLNSCIKKFSSTGEDALLKAAKSKLTQVQKLKKQKI